MKWAAAAVAMVALTKEGVGFDVSTRSASFDALLHAAAARGGLGKTLESGIANVWEHALDKLQERVSEQPLESASVNTAVGTREDHAGVKRGGTADVVSIRGLAELVSGGKSIDPADFVDRAHNDECCCCCCGPLVTNASLVNVRSASLDALLQQHGVLDCAGLAEAIDPTQTSALKPGKQQKQHVSMMRTGVLRDGRPVMMFSCSDCHQLGVGTLITTRESPFTVDLYGYCAGTTPRAGEDGGGGEGVFVTELMQSAQDWRRVDSSFQTVPQFVDMALRIIGSVKALNAAGRLMADYGTRQYMMSLNGNLKLTDVDCSMREDMGGGE
jgi:hypothetical protein